MLYKFKSSVCAEVIMLQLNAEELLKIIGKSPGPTGIITKDQIPGAIEALNKEIAVRDAQAQGIDGVMAVVAQCGEQLVEGDFAAGGLRAEKGLQAVAELRLGRGERETGDQRQGQHGAHLDIDRRRAVRRRLVVGLGVENDVLFGEIDDRRLRWREIAAGGRRRLCRRLSLCAEGQRHVDQIGRAHV